MWYQHKEYQRSVASITGKSPYRLTFYRIVKDDFLERVYEEVTKEIYADDQEAKDALYKLDYREVL